MNEKIKNLFNAFLGAFGVTTIFTIGFSLFFELITVIFCLVFIGAEGLKYIFTLKDIIIFLITPPALFLLLVLLIFLTIIEYNIHYKNKINKINKVDNTKYHAKHLD